MARALINGEDMLHQPSAMVGNQSGPAQRILEVDVSDEMVKKARAHTGTDETVTPTGESVYIRMTVAEFNERKADFARSAVRDAVREWNEVLTEVLEGADEVAWNDCADGERYNKAKELASALRKKFEVEE